MKKMRAAKAAIALSAVFAASACESVNTDRVREMNPFRRPATEAPKTPAPVRAGETSGVRPAAPAAPSAPQAPAGFGGPNTLSLSVTGCAVNCPMVTVMLDPDNYWQRAAPEGATSGTGRKNLYNDVSNVFQAQGFYAFQGRLDILPGNQGLCPDYEKGGQIYILSLSRNSGTRLINYDTGCAGSASADGAADAVNSLLTIPEYISIVQGG